MRESKERKSRRGYIFIGKGRGKKFRAETRGTWGGENREDIEKDQTRYGEKTREIK